MELALKILLGLVTLICLLGGTNLMLKGSNAFLPESVRPQPVLDNLFRFLSGIYFGLGFLMAWVVFHFNEVHDLIYFIGLVVVFSGLGRLYSKVKVGSAGSYFNSMMVIEIVLGLLIMVLQYLR
jgi:hypothetical protein